MPKSDVLSKARWSSIETTYKVNLAKLMFKIDKKTLPISILDTTEEVDVNTKKNLRSNAISISVSAVLTPTAMSDAQLS